jgi:hypothetical protein
VPLALTASITARDQRLTARVVNLSAGGALLRGNRPADVGDQLEMALGLPSGAQAQTPAVMLREGRLHGRPTFAVAFVGIAAPATQALAALVDDALARLRRAQVLVVDSSEAACRRVSERLGKLRLQAVATGTALDALVTLEAGVRLKAAMVNQFLMADDPVEVLAQVGKLQPRARRILVSATRGNPLGVVFDGGAGASEPQVILPSGWTESDLRQATRDLE